MKYPPSYFHFHLSILCKINTDQSLMQCKFRALQIQIVISVVNPLLCSLSCGFRALQINLIRPFCQFCQKYYLISQNLGKPGMHCCHLFFIPMMDRDKPRFQYRCKWNVITVYTDLAGFRIKFQQIRSSLIKTRSGVMISTSNVFSISVSSSRHTHYPAYAAFTSSIVPAFRK